MQYQMVFSQRGVIAGGPCEPKGRVSEKLMAGRKRDDPWWSNKGFSLVPLC